MARPILDALLAPGARPVVESGSEELAIHPQVFALDAPAGGALLGEGRVAVTGEHALAFLRPPELAAAGTLRLPNVGSADALRTAIADVHHRVIGRLRREIEVLAVLGFTPHL